MKILFYFLILHILLIVPGFVVIKKSGLLKNNVVTQLALGYALTTALFSIVMLLAYATGFSYDAIQLIFIPLIIFSLYIFIKEDYWRDLLLAKIPLFAIVMLSMLSTILIFLPSTKPTTIVPDPEFRYDRNYEVLNVKVLNVIQTNANDNYIPYRQAQFILNRSDPTTDSFISEWGVHFFQRTPLMGGVTAFILNLFGDKVPVDYTWSSGAQDLDLTYMKFQLISHILNALFLLPAYALILHFFNKKTAAITVLLLAVNQFFVVNAIFSWPKSYTAFFILLSWVILFTANRRLALIGGLIGGIAYLTHDLAVLFIGASVVALFAQKRFRDMLYVILGLLLAAIPWFITSSIIFKKTSSFIYYPFSLKDIPQPNEKEKILYEFFHTSPLKILWIKIQSLLYLLSPYQLILNDNVEILSKRLWTVGFFSIPGAVGLGLSVFSIAGMFKKIKNKALILALTFLPILFCVLIIGWPKGMGALHFAEPTVVLLTALGVYFILGLGRTRLLMLFIYLLSVVYLIYFTLYTYGFEVLSTWLNQPKSLVLLGVMSAQLVLVGVLIYLFSSKVPVRQDPLFVKSMKLLRL